MTTDQLLNRLWDEIWAALRNNAMEHGRHLLEEYCAKVPGDADARLLLAQVNGKMGLFPEMEHHSRQAVAIKPDHAIALYNLAFALAQQGKNKPAIDYCKQAISIQPDYAEVLYMLGELQSHIGNYDEAISTYKTALEYLPDDTDFLCRLGRALQKNKQHPDRLKNDLQQAREVFKKVLNLKPENSQAVAGLAAVLQKQGYLKQAYESLLPHINSDRPASEIVILYGQLCRHFDACDHAAELIEQELANNKLDNAQQGMLWKILGDIRDSLRQYDAAFSAYEQANKQFHPLPNPDTPKKTIQRQISAFSTDDIHALPRASNTSELPVFIVGMPRSGSTLVEQILAGHPQVFAAGEIRDIFRYTKQLACDDKSLSYPESIRCVDAQRLEQLAQTYLDQIRQFDPTALRVINKHIGNFLHLGLISRLFPGARIIHTRRDPLDTCVSCYFQNFVMSGLYDKNLENIGRFYRLYETLMAHWQQVLDNPIFEVQYENLVTDMVSTVRQLVAFLGLDWDPACLDFYQHERVVQTASADQVNRPLYTSSVGRWKNYQAHLGPLKIGLGME